MIFSEILTSPEGKTLEFKRDTSALKQIMRTIVAFANTARGMIIIGREDDGKVTGVEDPLLMEEQLANAISDSIAPAIIPDIEIFTIEKKSLLCIRVVHWPGPFYVQSEGQEQGVYIRIGSTNRKAGPEFIAEIERQHRNRSFDQLPCPAYGVEALDMPYIQKIFTRLGRTVGEEQLVSLGILTPFGGRNVPTHGGIILFGKPDVRQQALPDARVSCARFSGTNKSEFLDQLDFEGSIIEVIEQVPAFIRRNTMLYPKIEGMKREDIPAYPAFAVREILVNSVVHCDYSLIGMRVMVAIFADRMEIQSPGILPMGITLEDFKAGVSRIRNRVIARTFRELGHMEEWGSGYKRVVDFCHENGYLIPEWQEVGPTIRVTILPHPDVQEISPHDTPHDTPHVTPHVEQLLILCETPSGRAVLQKHLGVKDRKYFYQAYLTPALEAGLLELTIPDKPKSKLQKYRLTSLGLRYLKNAGMQQSPMTNP